MSLSIKHTCSIKKNKEKIRTKDKKEPEVSLNIFINTWKTPAEELGTAKH